MTFAVPADERALEGVVPELARQVIKSLSPAAHDHDLMGTYQLEMVAGDYLSSESTLDALRRRYRAVGAPLALLVYPEMMTAAAKDRTQSGATFESAIAAALHRIHGPLPDQAYMDAEYWSAGPGTLAKQQLETDRRESCLEPA